MNPIAIIALAAAGIGIAVAVGGGGGVVEVTSSKQLLELDQREPGPGVVLMYGPESQSLRDALDDCKGVRRVAIRVDRMIEWYKAGEFPALPIDEEPDDIAAHAPIAVAANEHEMAIFGPADVIAKAKASLAEQGWGTDPSNLGLGLYEFTGDPTTDAATLCSFAKVSTVAEGPGAGAPPVGKGMGLYLVLAAQGQDLPTPQEPPAPQGPQPPGPGVPGLNQEQVDPAQAGFKSVPAVPYFEVKGAKIFTVKGEKIVPKVDLMPADVVVPLADQICNGGKSIQKVEVSVNPDPHKDWGLYQFCVARFTAGNPDGLPPGYYFTIWRMNATEKLSFGPFPDLREIPGGRPEIDVESAIEFILEGTYAKAKSLAI